MAYKWDGIRKISFEDIKQLHNANALSGYLMLYSDNTECYIEDNYDWNKIVRHYENGGEFGCEVPYK